jgi:NDP-sugar pyrophosphorylase family protein
MKLFVLAGGFGTRLQSVVSQVPKAMAPIGKLPFLHFQMENWLSQGVTSFVFLLHHQAETIIDFLDSYENRMWNHLEIKWLIEPRPLGTGGAIYNAVTELQISDDFLVVNADTWIDSGLAQVARAEVPAMGVTKVQDASRYGSIEFDVNRTATCFWEKNEIGGSGWINTGVTHLNASLFRHKLAQPASLENDFFPEWVRSGILKVVPLECNFIDIGVPQDYFRFCNWIAKEKTDAL